jgi:signal transduction histidine kinase
MTTQTLTETKLAAPPEQQYEHPETRDLVALVHDAAELVRAKGSDAFDALREDGSRWRTGEMYVFVLAPDGRMLVHPDATLEGTDAIDLKDVAGKPIIRGLIEAATSFPHKTEGWYHYQWPVPGGLLPRWKSSFVRLVQAPSGERFVVGSGVYNDRMERAFVVDMVTNAVALLEAKQEAAFPIFRDPTGPYRAKDAYVFVLGTDGIELVNPAFPAMEGRYVLDMADAHGKNLHPEMIHVVQTRGAGWVDYHWPKPGESVATRKSAYVHGAKLGDRTMVVGCGVYFEDAPKDARRATAITAPELTQLVREAAALLAERGEQAYADFRTKGSKWFNDDVYFYVLTMDGIRAFVATEPENEGKDASGRKDVLGRPYGRMILDVGASPSGEGWVHYMYPLPGTVFPAWKSAFVKRVNFPSGVPHLVAAGVYNMRMDETFIEDVVNRAATLIAERGRAAFDALRDRTGPFVFMDTYVFVDSADGVELVNAAQPSLEGRNLMELRDPKGKALVREEIEAAMRLGSAWLDGYWYRPGSNTPALKRTLVRKVQSGTETFIVGSGIYVE